MVMPLLMAGVAAASTVASPVSLSDLIEVTDIASLGTSPDGRWVAFRTSQPSIGDNRIRLEWYVAPLDGSTPARPVASGGDTEVNSGLVENQSPVWAPSSQAFYFRAAIGGEAQVWRAPVDGGAVRQVTHVPSDIRSISLAPDGHSLAAEIGASREDVQRAEQDIKDNGVLIDGTVDVSATLSGNATIKGHVATEQFSQGWFVRQPLLWDKDVHSVEMPLPPADQLSVFPKNRSDLTVRIETAGESQQLRWIDGKGNERACVSAACPTTRIRSAVALGNRTDVLVTTADAERAETLSVWTPVSGQWRTLLQATGTLDGGTINGYPPCAATRDEIVCVSAGPSEPPQLVRIDLCTGRVTPLFDPNSSLRARAWPTTALHWRTKSGQEIAGQLMLPTSPRPHSGYPLALTYYACDGFLRGGLGDELPLAPLAEAGIATLCINKASHAGDTERETEDTAIDAITVILDRLVEQGLIDRARVGMSGLSFGSQVTMAVLEQTSLIRAAAIASAQIEPYYYWVNGIAGRSVLGTLKSYYGLGDPDTDRRSWVKGSEISRITRIKAPLLMQLPESEMRMAIETYGRLARTTTPVEMYAYPNETHIKWMPRHKLAVYKRNLDWFRYWLQGDRDTDPVLDDQYRRWTSFSARPGFALPVEDHSTP
jgi:dipeptidyl aminopeptidase/acylaminoacyl peptidase